MNKIYLNLPVSDLQRSIDFYTAIGFEEQLNFKDTLSTGMRLGDITLMILETSRFKDFTSKRIVDANTEVEAIFAFSMDSRKDVDLITEKALALGSIEPSPIEDYPYMYGRSFTDPDGHLWGPFFYDEALANQ